uniref:NLR family CARD domain containing 6 n=1 Tax=Cyprinus carpio carpio TaxID=630221 RepID=A0A9J8BYT3_CYPCA
SNIIICVCVIVSAELRVKSVLFCRLRYCGVTDEGCAALSSALRSNSSQLRELHLFGNKVGDAGVKLLSALKDDPRYKLKTLML